MPAPQPLAKFRKRPGLDTPNIQQTDRLIAANQAFRNRSPGANLTAQNIRAGIAPGPYAAGRVKVGGGLRLGQPETPALSAALGRPDMSQTTVLNRPAAPAGPRFQTEDVLANAAAGQNAAQDVAARSKFGTTAIPLSEQRTAFTEDGTPYLIPGLRGNRQMQNPMDMAKRQAYLDRVADVQAQRQAGVAAKAQQRSEARTARLEARKRGPSLMEQLAARNPQLAAQLAAIQGQRDIAGIQAGGRKGVAEIEAGWRGKAQEGQQRATDVAADVAIMTSPDASPQDKMAAAQRISAARGGGTARGAGAGGMTALELPPDQREALDQADLPEAEQVMRNQGVSEESIKRYREQRQRDYQNSLRMQRTAVNVGSLFQPTLLAGNVAARVRGLFDAPPVGLNPDVVARLTPEQRRKIGVPEPKPRKRPLQNFRGPIGSNDFFPAGG